MTIEDIDRRVTALEGVAIGKNRIGDIERRLFFDEKSRDIVSSTPSYIPSNSREEIAFYVNGTTYRQWSYLFGVGWTYVTLTKP